MIQIYMSFSGFVSAQVKQDIDIRFVRAAFVSRGDSLHAWARRNEFSAVHVLRSIRGDYAGPKALEALRKLRSELGVG